jgi:hypothetical protein
VDRYRDDTSFVMTVDAWRTMSHHMGVENMGGVAVGFLPELPRPTVTYGAVMQHDDRTGEMIGFTYGSATGGEHAGHGAEPAAPATDPHAGHGEPPAAEPTPDPHAGHEAPTAGVPAPVTGGMPGMAMSAAMMQAMDFVLRLLSDPEVESRIHANPRLHELWSDPDVQRHLQMMRQRRNSGAGHEHNPRPEVR